VNTCNVSTIVLQKVYTRGRAWASAEVFPRGSNVNIC